MDSLTSVVFDKFIEIIPNLNLIHPKITFSCSKEYVQNNIQLLTLDMNHKEKLRT